MAKTILSKSVRWLMAAGAVATLAVAGCFPVAWLPDSSGFVYTDGGDFRQLVHYDVAKGERRVLVEKMPAATLWLALSPDGKTVAVARLTRVKGMERTLNLQIIVYDLKGKEVQRSAEFPWTTEYNGSSEGPIGAGVFWAASDGKLIVHNFDDPVKTGVYDPAKKTLVTLDGYPAAFGGTPVRPDGKGFLITRKDGGPESLKVFLADWDGKTQPIDLKTAALDNADKADVIQFPWAGTSGWKGAVAEVSYGGTRVRIDTDKRTGTFEAIPKSEAVADDKNILQQYAFPDGAKVRVLGAEQATVNTYQLEYIKAGESKPKVLKVQEKSSFILLPSPDRKWLAARVVGEDKSIFLISAKGEVKEIAGNNTKAD
jgi:hypothetical protein